ncbi:sensor histidine kinase [Sphingomonas sp.]|uniref:sensor histidine kinase n=1 Tax=Sphingomonas sp. TaxID=28214 RepID=UPI002DD64B2D|nr:HAMP domain-containing sensor histidine kinase [Sphingomonas sp.]
MTALDHLLHPVTARTDLHDRLVDADPRLRDLIARAGGGAGQEVPIPAIAGVVRLARRLGIAIAREIVVADGEDDLELDIRAEPDDGGVTILAGGWRARTPWRGAGEARDFLASEADWLWESDAALRFTHISPYAGTRWGFDAAAMLGQPIVRLFALAEDGEGGFPILGAVAAQMRFDRQDAELRGTGRRARLIADPRVDARGRFAGFTGAVRMLDVEASDPPPLAPPIFAAGFGERIERSLRGPLERIIANAGSMGAQVEGPLSDNYVGYAADIASAGRHLLGMIDDLVDLEAIERPDFVIATETVDVAELARRAAGLLSVRANEGDVRIERPGPDEMLAATGEYRRVLQILVNLIGNAVRYSPPGATVGVQTGHGADTVMVTVTDHGKGIAAADQAMIFDKFGRVDPAEPGGSGLGLYISRRLARAMGGDITVESTPGEGARFTLALATDPARHQD